MHSLLSFLDHMSCHHRIKQSTLCSIQPQPNHFHPRNIGMPVQFISYHVALFTCFLLRVLEYIYVDIHFVNQRTTNIHHTLNNIYTERWTNTTAPRRRWTISSILLIWIRRWRRRWNKRNSFPTCLSIRIHTQSKGRGRKGTQGWITSQGFHVKKGKEEVGDG